MKPLFTLFICVSLLQFAHAQQRQASGSQKQQTSFPSGEAYKNSEIIFKYIPAANNTWCYDIYSDDRLMIHQPSVPGLPGNEGFKTKEQAKKVAQLVIKKIKNGEMPPSVSTEEMTKLKVL
jgi:hypothetical protein